MPSSIPSLLHVAVPEPAAMIFAARHPGFRLARAASLPYALGLVLPLLARHEPFSRAPLGLRVALTSGELARGHHLIVLRGGVAAAYSGWAACSEEQGRRFLGPEGIHALDFARIEGEAIAFLTAAAADGAAFAALRTAMRALHPGVRYVARRVHGAAKRAVVPRGGIIAPLPELRATP